MASAGEGLEAATTGTLASDFGPDEAPAPEHAARRRKRKANFVKGGLLLGGMCAGLLRARQTILVVDQHVDEAKMLVGNPQRCVRPKRG